MAASLLPDALWDLVEPLLPIPPRRPQGGRPRVSDRACLTGILFVLRSGIRWQMLPQELGCGSGPDAPFAPLDHSHLWHRLWQSPEQKPHAHCQFEQEDRTAVNLYWNNR